jgi:Isochorismatase family
MNAFEDEAFREALEATGRKRLIIGGLHTEICLTFATVPALKGGYDAMFLTDAVGGRSQVAHRTGIERLSHAGAVPTTALAVNTELFRDWGGGWSCRGPPAGKHRRPSPGGGRGQHDHTGRVQLMLTYEHRNRDVLEFRARQGSRRATG